MFTSRQRAAILWAEHVAKNTARTRDDIFEQVKSQFDDAEFVELTGICGTFAANNRFQDSLKLPLEPQSEIDKIKHSIFAQPDKIRLYIEHVVRAWPLEFPVPRAIAGGPAGRPIAGSTKVGAATDLIAAHRALPRRLSLVDPGTATGEAARYFRFAELLLAHIPNAIRIWAHSPYIVKLFLPFHATLTREGAGSILPVTLRTMVRIRTSWLNAAPYSLAHTTALGRHAGVSEAQIAALLSRDASANAAFSPPERAALAWAEQVVANKAKFRDDVFDDLKRHFDDAEAIELTGLCAVSNMVDLIQNALRVPLESDSEIDAMNRELRMDPARLKRYLESLLAEWPERFPTPRD